MIWALVGFVGLFSGLAIAWVGSYVHRRKLLSEAQEEAQEILSHAEDQARILDQELNEQLEDLKEEAEKQFERDTKRKVQEIHQAQSRLAEKEELIQERIRSMDQKVQSRHSAIQSRDKMIQGLQQRFDDLKKRTAEIREQLKSALVPASQVQLDELKSQMILKLEEESSTLATRAAQAFEEEHQYNLEREAKRLLHVVLNRFARAYCPERGIGNVSFSSLEELKRVVGPDRKNLNLIEKICGVDISINEEYHSASVLGFDPVRRELGRACLERMSKERNITESSIQQNFERIKRDLFRKIASDGQKLTRELKLTGMHEEVVNMMGALRYRYSFAQNQYFHCSEVGWLCGLLSSELGVNTTDGRRSGLLHDIGKAMDHSKDGGHAVIGADFIERHNEAPQIVHAVRAHHYDEQPSTDLAYLVIAADAISGARPGARRSTIDSYSQKMADLEKIGNSFDGVMATYILSAGREVRIIVDSRRCDDMEALKLSKKIAQKIEEECSYPGLIKVTVVRETQAVEFAK